MRGEEAAPNTVTAVGEAELPKSVGITLLFLFFSTILCVKIKKIYKGFVAE